MKSRFNLARFFLTGVAGVVVVAISLLPCTASEAAKDTLIIGVAATPATIDYESGGLTAAQPLLINSTMETGALYPMIPSKTPGMEHVLVPNFEDLTNLRPNLFTNWEVSPDRKTATFHLKKGVKSAYGNELTTKDVLWKYKRHFAMKAVGAFMMAVTDVPSMDSIKIIDDYTFQTVSEGSNALQEALMTNSCDTIWDSTEAKKYATADDPWAHGWITRHGGGFGAYYVKKWEAGQEIILEANPNYWKGVPEIKKVIFKVIPESSSRVVMLRKGVIDMALELSPVEVNSLEDAPGVKIISIRCNLFDFVVMNQELVEPFTNRLVRQAINCAIPREDIVRTAHYGHARPFRAIISTMFPTATGPEEWMYHYDLDKARQLLVEAGYPDGFEVELEYAAGWPTHETTAVLIRDSLKKIGIDVSLRKMPTGALATRMYSEECPFGIGQESAFVPDPFYSMILYYLSRKAGGAYGALGHYSNPKVDKMLQEGIRAWPSEKQYELAKEAQKVIMEEAPWGWIVEVNFLMAARDNIEGPNWNLSQGVLFNMMRFTE